MSEDDPGHNAGRRLLRSDEKPAYRHRLFLEAGGRETDLLVVHASCRVADQEDRARQYKSADDEQDEPVERAFSALLLRRTGASPVCLDRLLRVALILGLSAVLRVRGRGLLRRWPPALRGTAVLRIICRQVSSRQKGRLARGRDPRPSANILMQCGPVNKVESQPAHPSQPSAI